MLNKIAQEIHEKFMDTYRLDPRPVKHVAHEIGISGMSLGKFIKKEVPPSLMTLIKIENWIKKKQ